MIIPINFVYLEFAGPRCFHPFKILLLRSPLLSYTHISNEVHRDSIRVLTVRRDGIDGQSSTLPQPWILMEEK